MRQVREQWLIRHTATSEAPVLPAAGDDGTSKGDRAVDYSKNVDELASALDRAVASHLEGELGSAKGRAGSLITPFATLVGSAHAKQEEELAALKRAREELDGLANEAKELRKGS